MSLSTPLPPRPAYSPRERWGRVLASLVVAAGLWVMTFYLQWLNFWLSMTATTLILILMAYWGQREEIFPPVSRPGLVLVGAVSAVLLYLVFFLGDMLTAALLPFARSQVESVYQIKTQAPRWLVALLFIFPIASGEEIYWRGFVQRQLARTTSPTLGWILATLAYTAVHLAALNLMLAIAAFTASLAWGYLYRRYDTLVPCIASHLCWNYLIFLLFPLA